MSRARHTRRPSRSLSRSLTQRFGDLFRSGDSWFDANNVTTSGGKVVSFVDYISTSHTLTQGNSSLRVAAPIAVAALAGKRAVQPTSAEYYDSTRPPSAWKYLHDGTGCEYYHVFIGDSSAGDQTLHATCNIVAGSTTIGSFAETNFVAGNLLGGYFVTNGTTSPANGRIIATSGFLLQTGGAGNSLLCGGWYKEGAGTDFTVYVNAASATSGSTSGAPSASNPTNTLRLFQNYGTAFGFKGVWHAAYYFQRVLTGPERLLLQKYIQSTAGVS